MTDPENEQSCPVPDPTIVDPFPPARNGQCAPDGFTNGHHPAQPEAFTGGQEMKITDSMEGEGNFTRRFQGGRGKRQSCGCYASEGPCGSGIFDPSYVFLERVE